MQNAGILAEKKRVLTDKQKSFLGELFNCEGNIGKAMEKAGYKPLKIDASFKEKAWIYTPSIQSKYIVGTQDDR